MVSIQFMIIIYLSIHRVTCSDPCTHGQELHSPGKRGGKCVITKSSKQICDRYIKEGWYKVQHEEDAVPRQMIDKCPRLYSGGTLFPVWLNGTHPTKLNDVVNRTVCQSGASSCCDNKFDIQIKKCARHYVYRLSPLSECKSAYSFGETLECAVDPCDDETYAILTDNGDRSVHCQRKYNQLCDDQLPNVWQRVQRNGKDLPMPTTCVEALHCATERPMWLRGNPPTIKEKTSKKEVCVSGKLSCCQKSYTIFIRNCTSFLVYNLTKPTDCPERYCFGYSALCGAVQSKSVDEKTECDWICILIILLLLLLGGSIITVALAICKSQVCSNKTSNGTAKAKSGGQDDKRWKGRMIPQNVRIGPCDKFA